MATSRLIALHCGKGRSIGTAISDIIEYVKNPDKVIEKIQKNTCPSPKGIVCRNASKPVSWLGGIFTRLFRPSFTVKSW